MNLYRAAFPLLRCLDPERAHGLAICALSQGLTPKDKAADNPALAVTLWGQVFTNPIGLAAGFDKDAGAMVGLFGLGFGFVEVGSITPRPQAGNPKPRIFRLASEEAVINRLGFNSQGLDVAAERLARWHARGTSPGRLGVNLGKNKESEDAARDYALGARRLAPFADYLVVNVSSPNTPGLRALQAGDELRAILSAVREALAHLPEAQHPPLLVKIAPDLSRAEVGALASALLEQAVDGVIATNSTVARPADLTSQARAEVGGLSGRPLFAASTQVLSQLYDATEGRLPLIGTGGVSSGADAYAKICAGASLVQLYTGLIYGGPRLIAEIKRDLVTLLKRDGFAAIGDAVGADHR